MTNTTNPTNSQQKTASFEAALGGYPSRENLSTSFGGSTCAESDLSSIASLANSQNIVKGCGPEGNRTPGTGLDRSFPHQAGPTPYSSYRTNKNPATNWLLLGIAGFALLVLIPPAIILGGKAFAPPPPTISPLAEASTPPSGPTPQPAAAKIYAPSDYLYLSQRYFADAYTISQKRQQTEEDKKEILANLQKAINTISEGISLYPNTAELWTQRANFYLAIQSIAPQAKEAALHDIEKAQSISQHSPSAPSSPSQPSGLELVKEEQVNSRDVIVAAPDEATSPYEDTKETSAITGTATIPAGQTTLTVENMYVTDESPVYVVPKTQIPAVLTVVKKISGSGFIVALDNAQTIDISFQYWVTK